MNNIQQPDMHEEPVRGIPSKSRHSVRSRKSRAYQYCKVQWVPWSPEYFLFDPYARGWYSSTFLIGAQLCVVGFCHFTLDLILSCFARGIRFALMPRPSWSLQTFLASPMLQGLTFLRGSIGTIHRSWNMRPMRATVQFWLCIPPPLPYAVHRFQAHDRPYRSKLLTND